MRKRQKNKKVMLFGTFDLFHPGHQHLLRQARRYGNHITVVVARDRTVLKLKGRLPRHGERQRLKAIEHSGLTDKVILGNLTDKYGAIKRHGPGVICLGYDQKFFIADLKRVLVELGLAKTKIVRLKPYKPQIYKSSKLLKKL